LLYPDYFGCKPWDRIPESDKENFEIFRQGKIPSWGVPPWQTFLLYLNLISVLACVILPFVRVRVPAWRISLPAEEGAGA